MTTLEIARHLVQLWFTSTRNTPLNQCRDRLEHIIARALDEIDQNAYNRGFRDAVLAEIENSNGEENNGNALAGYAAKAGAQGTWLIRGATNFDLLFNLAGDGLPVMLNLEDAPLIFVARFPTANGGEPGIEHR